MNEIICHNCRAINRWGANFCATCGQGLIAAVAPGDEAPTVPDSSLAFLEHGSFELRIGRRTDTGRMRQTNEDSLLAFDFLCANKSVSRPVGFFVVADGLGGHAGGEIASGMLVQALARRAAEEWLSPAITGQDESFDREVWLRSAIATGNEEIYEHAREAGIAMGTTVVAAIVEGDRAFIAHVGDSRAYHLRADDIRRITVDHSLVESLVVARRISPEEARNHPQANVIYRTVGDSPQVAVDVSRITLRPGDFLMLCSDGLSGMLDDEAIREVVLDASSPQAACDALVDAANQAGGEDNCTVILIELKSS